MSEQPLRILHYVNQFFGGIGGEEQANHPPELREGPVGPGRLLASIAPNDRIVGTLICGDNFFQERREQALAALSEAMVRLKPDLLLAGPAFQAGRYGIACAEISRAAAQAGLPAVAAMHVDNPAVPIYCQQTYIASTGPTPTAMPAALRTMLGIGRKLASGQELGPAAAESYFPHGVRRQGFRDQPGAKRAVDMLVAKLRSEPFVSEVPYQPVDRVTPASPLADLSHAAIALLTTGGLVRKGNPDRMPSSNATRFLRIDVSGMDDLSPDDFQAYHAGYFNGIACADPNYILPLRYVRELEQRGQIGRVHPTIYGLPGVGTPVAAARRLGSEIAQELHAADIGAALLVAT
jgi:glycine/betaine/sarcosine/D-proline reductase family selenoprotein B